MSRKYSVVKGVVEDPRTIEDWTREVQSTAPNTNEKVWTLVAAVADAERASAKEDVEARDKR